MRLLLPPYLGPDSTPSGGHLLFLMPMPYHLFGASCTSWTSPCLASASGGTRAKTRASSMGSASPRPPHPTPPQHQAHGGCLKEKFLTQTHRSRERQRLECMLYLGLAEWGARGPQGRRAALSIVLEGPILSAAALPDSLVKPWWAQRTRGPASILPRREHGLVLRFETLSRVMVEKYLSCTENSGYSQCV